MYQRLFSAIYVAFTGTFRRSRCTPLKERDLHHRATINYNTSMVISAHISEAEAERHQIADRVRSMVPFFTISGSSNGFNRPNA